MRRYGILEIAMYEMEQVLPGARCRFPEKNCGQQEMSLDTMPMQSYIQSGTRIEMRRSWMRLSWPRLFVARREK